MAKLVQRTKFDPEAGQFLLRINSQIASVAREVVRQLRVEFADDASFQHLVWLESHPEHSVLVVTPVRSDDPMLIDETTEAAEHYVRQALIRRKLDRAS